MTAEGTTSPPKGRTADGVSPDRFAQEFEAKVAPRLEEAKEQLARVNVRVTDFIRRNPGTSLLCAVGVGYLIGKLAARR